MLRMIGTALLAGGSVLLGGCAVRHLNARVRELDDLIHGLHTMLRELEYRLAPLPELLMRAAEQTGGHVSDFFRLGAQGAEHLNGRTFQMVWRQTVEAGQLRLEQSDLDVLDHLGGVLGRYDGESQRQALRESIDRLEHNRQEAEDQSCRLGRVYRVLGLVGGAFILILMI